MDEKEVGQLEEKEFNFIADEVKPMTEAEKAVETANGMVMGNVDETIAVDSVSKERDEDEIPFNDAFECNPNCDCHCGCEEEEEMNVLAEMDDFPALEDEPAGMEESCLSDAPIDEPNAETVVMPAGEEADAVETPGYARYDSLDELRKARPHTYIIDAVVWDKEGAKRILAETCKDTAICFFADAPVSDEMKRLEASIVDLKDKLAKYIEERSVKTFTYKMVGCKKCGSQLAKDLLKGDTCPLCGNDLRSPSTIEGENRLKARILEAEEALRKETDRNHVMNGKRQWLVYR